MACDLTTTQANACLSHIARLDNEIPLLQAIAQSMATTVGGESTLSAIQQRACESGIGWESDRLNLLRIIAQNLCSSVSEAEMVEAIVDSFAERSGITDQTQIDSLTALVTSARANGWWDKSDVIYPFVGGTAAAHAQNLKSSNHTITWAGTVVHDANGITGNGVDGVGDTGYDPSTDGVQYQLNSAHATVYRRTMGAFPNTWYFGSAGGGSDMSLRQTLGFVQLALNGGGFGHSTVALGLVAASRTSADEVVGYSPDGSTVIASPSITIPSVDASVLAITGTDGVPGNFTGANLAFLTVGGGISAGEYASMQADIQTFQTANGRAV